MTHLFRLLPSAFRLLLLSAFRLLPSAFCVLTEVAEACPFCKDALWAPGGAATQSRLAQGFAFTILGMITVPLVLVGGIAVLVVRSARRAKRSPRVSPR